MATLVLSAFGTFVGGPIGGTIGALIGQQVDGAVFGPKPVEGPRLKELALTTSTYGQPLPRHYGRMRTGGTVIWATDLQEDKETSSGKGRPKTTTFSYSASFAVALGNGPVERVGRIWADGNLLRGADGDLKVAGAMRFHSGHGDQRPDPLLSAAEGALCPAFRGCAYIVFEDLQLADFGNRLPMLTFEVFAGDGANTLAAMFPSDGEVEVPENGIAQLEGYSHDGGTWRQVLSAFGDIAPLRAVGEAERLRLALEDEAAEPILLTEAAAWPEGEFGRQSGSAAKRQGSGRERVEALRYYDVERDYQPGLQRTAGRYEHGQSRQIDFPGTLTASGARELVDAAAQRSLAAQETLVWRAAELDPAVSPGTVVRVPGRAGLWRVQSWEWREAGVELALVRHVPSARVKRGGAAGSAWAPPDLSVGPTLLRFFELPPASLDEVSRPVLWAAVRSSGSLWKGAALYRDRQGELVPLAQTAVRQAAIGQLRTPLPPSSALRFEAEAACEVDFGAAPVTLASASLAGLADGANRILIGTEVLQFAHTRRISGNAWRLSGLLRGRGGTEGAAAAGHIGGTNAVLLDAGLTRLESGEFAADAAPELLAIGLGDAEPVAAPLLDAGASRRPLPPVHGRARQLADGGVELSWTRRARGAWLWLETMDVPLVEERERYLVGIGDPAAPAFTWEVSEARLLLSTADLQRVGGSALSSAFWVRQIGSFALSETALLPTT